MSFVCVQPMVSSWARRAEDLTVDKTDEKDAVLIARLTTQLRCYVPEYVPEPVDSTWARLRHLGARREQLITDASSQVQQIRDLLECVWPTALDTARQPFRSQTWTAALTVIAEVEARMTGVLDELGLTRLATSIPGLSAVGAAAILAQTGDPRRFATARALVKHAGLAPRQKTSGAFVGRTKPHRPRPARAAAGRLARRPGCPPFQPCLCRPLPAPDHPRAQQAPAHPGPDRPRRRHPSPPPRRDHHRPDLGPRHRHSRQPNTTRTSRRLTRGRRGASSWRSGRALRGIETHRDLDAHHGQPRPSSDQPDHALPGPTPFSYAGTDDGRGTDPSLTQSASR